MTKREIINASLKEANDYIKFVIENVCRRIYYKGKSDFMDKLQNYLIINPEKLDELNNMKTNPCKSCKYSTSQLLIGCEKNPIECDKKQNQLFAIEILDKYEKVNE